MVAVESPQSNLTSRQRLAAINIRSADFKARSRFKAWCISRHSNMEHALRQIIDQINAGKLRPVIQPFSQKSVGKANLSINIRSVEFDARTQFKIWCAKKNSNMEHALRQIIDQINAGVLNPRIDPALEKNFGN